MRCGVVTTFAPAGVRRSFCAPPEADALKALHSRVADKKGLTVMTPGRYRKRPSRRVGMDIGHTMYRMHQASSIRHDGNEVRR